MKETEDNVRAILEQLNNERKKKEVAVQALESIVGGVPHLFAGDTSLAQESLIKNGWSQAAQLAKIALTSIEIIEKDAK